MMGTTTSKIFPLNSEENLGSPMLYLIGVTDEAGTCEIPEAFNTSYLRTKKEKVNLKWEKNYDPSQQSGSPPL